MNNRKLSDIGKFNKTIDKLLGVCRKTYPEVVDELKYYEHQLDLGRRANPRLVVEEFMKVMGGEQGEVPYIEQIMSRNEQFFIARDASEVAKADEAQILNKIKGLWVDSHNAELKEKIWQLFQLLLMYGVKVNKNHAHLTIINKYRTTPMGFD